VNDESLPAAAGVDGPLRGKRIIEVGGRMVSYAGRLLSDLGADVIVLERPASEDVNAVPPHATSPSGIRVSLDREYRQQTKRSVAVDWTSPDALPLLRLIGADADAVLVTSRPGRAVVGLSPRPALEWAADDAVVCAVTAYGLTGPQRHWRATPFTAFAGSGLMSVTGPVDGPPLAMPGAHMFDLAGVRAAYLVQASLLTRRDDAGGVAIDLSVHESASWQKLTIDQFDTSGRIPDRRTNFGPPPGGVWQCRDGRVDIAAHALHHWSIFVDVLGRPEELASPLYEDRAMRVQLFDLLTELIKPYMAERGAADFVDRAQAAGLPCALSFDPGEIADDPHMVDRQFFVTVESAALGSVRVPGHPFRSDPPLQVPRRPASAAGADTDSLCRELGVSEERSSTWRALPASAERGPLAGLRVISFGTFVVGNVCATMLSDLGAEVAKVESPRRPEALRSYFSLDHPNIHEPSGIRTTNMFASLTSGQRSISLNMDVDSGRDLFRRLVTEADVVVENFSPGQLDRWGCGFETLSRLRPGLVLASLTGYGQTGRRARYRAYASNIANYLGLASSWAFDGTHFDFVGAHHATSAILAAVESVRRGGPAVHIDMAQAETGAAVMAPLYLASINGGPAWSQGPNEVPGSALSAVFACLGDDGWVAVDLEDAADAAEARALLELGEVDTDDEGAMTSLRAALTTWCAGLTPYQAALRLQRVGLAAAVVENLEDLWRDPQLRSRGFYRDVVHPDIGWRELPASPDQVALGLPRTTRPGSRLGADTSPVLRSWLGLSDGEIDKLEDAEACWRPPTTRKDVP